MKLQNVKIENFRLLKDCSFSLKDEGQKDLTLLIGKNNTGKTSLIVLFEKFLKGNDGKSSKGNGFFSFDDFSIGIRKNILELAEKEIDEIDEYSLSIKLILTIKYSTDDSWEYLSEFITDLGEERDEVNILFESTIKKKSLKASLNGIVEKEDREKYIRKYIQNYQEVKIYTFDDMADLKSSTRSSLFIKKDSKDINNLINLKIIHAKRDVASSEANSSGKKTLSRLTTKYYNQENKLSHNEALGINKAMIEMDKKLDVDYESFFKGFLINTKDFLGIDDILVKSDLAAAELLLNNSKIVYGSDTDYLPEHLNGLGYMNILYLLLEIEIKKKNFIQQDKDLNILFIEEPEAHTHPQMQVVFIKKVKELLGQIKNLQTIISTHSAQIVRGCDFEDIRYMRQSERKNEIEIKNFCKELEKKYEDDKGDEDRKLSFKFLKQYLTIESAECFFADKIIFIEGTTERLLLPYFMEQMRKGTDSEEKISFHNTSILEVGANAKAFRHFIEFLGIKALIITDIDTTKATEGKTKNKNGEYKITNKACAVIEADNTSNYSIKYYLNYPSEQVKEQKKWIENLKSNYLDSISPNLIKVVYQTEEKVKEHKGIEKYQGRSFEDAFISINIENITKNLEELQGLKNKGTLNKTDYDSESYYELTDKILDSKSNFPSSVLWLALAKEVEWNIPAYIKTGLTWIVK